METYVDDLLNVNIDVERHKKTTSDEETSRVRDTRRSPVSHLGLLFRRFQVLSLSDEIRTRYVDAYPSRTLHDLRRVVSRSTWLTLGIRSLTRKDKGGDILPLSLIGTEDLNKISNSFNYLRFTDNVSTTNYLLILKVGPCYNNDEVPVTVTDFCKTLQYSPPPSLQ